MRRPRTPTLCLGQFGIRLPKSGGAFQWMKWYCCEAFWLDVEWAGLTKSQTVIQTVELLIHDLSEVINTKLQSSMPMSRQLLQFCSLLLTVLFRRRNSLTHPSTGIPRIASSSRYLESSSLPPAFSCCDYSTPRPHRPLLLLLLLLPPSLDQNLSHPPFLESGESFTADLKEYRQQSWRTNSITKLTAQAFRKLCVTKRQLWQERCVWRSSDAKAACSWLQSRFCCSLTPFSVAMQHENFKDTTPQRDERTVRKRRTHLCCLPWQLQVSWKGRFSGKYSEQLCQSLFACTHWRRDLVFFFTFL